MFSLPVRVWMTRMGYVERDSMHPHKLLSSVLHLHGTHWQITHWRTLEVEAISFTITGAKMEKYSGWNGQFAQRKIFVSSRRKGDARQSLSSQVMWMGFRICVGKESRFNFHRLAVAESTLPACSSVLSKNILLWPKTTACTSTANKKRTPLRLQQPGWPWIRLTG